jgi:hypothetical protein
VSGMADSDCHGTAPEGGGGGGLPLVVVEEGGEVEGEGERGGGVGFLSRFRGGLGASGKGMRLRGGSSFGVEVWPNRSSEAEYFMMGGMGKPKFGQPSFSRTWEGTLASRARASFLDGGLGARLGGGLGEGSSGAASICGAYDGVLDGGLADDAKT